MPRFLLRTPDGQAGLSFIGFGAVVAWFAAGYELGTPAHMGPGFFPFVLGLLLIGLGLAVLVTSRATATELAERGEWRAVLCVTAAVALGGVILARFGLFPAVVAATFIAALAEPSPRWLRVALVSAMLCGFAWLVFVAGLELRLPIWRF